MSSFKVKNNFASVLNRTKTAIDETLKETAVEVVEEIKTLAPRKTGELANSYTYEIEGEKVIIGSPLERALPAEFGTATRAAHPHVLPAVLQAQDKITKKLGGKMNAT